MRIGKNVLYLMIIYALVFNLSISTNIRNEENAASEADNNRANVDINGAGISVNGNHPSDAAHVTANANGSSASSSIGMSTSPGGDGRASTIVVAVDTPNGKVSSTKTSSIITGSGSGIIYTSSSSSSTTTTSSGSNTNVANTSTSNPSNNSSNNSSSNNNNFSNTNIPVTTTYSTDDPNLYIPKQLTNYNIKTVNSSWKSLNFQADELSLSPQGSLQVISQNLIYDYDFLSNTFTNIEANITFRKIALAPDSTPYAINTSNELLYLSQTKQWMQLNVCALDLALSKTGELYYIECQNRNVIKLQCSDEEGKVFTKNIHLLQNMNCQAVNLGGTAFKIEVLIQGTPVIISNSGQILYLYKSSWEPFFSMFGSELAVSNEGYLYIVATDGSIFAVNYFSNPVQIYKLPGQALSIAVSAFSLPIMISRSDNNLYSLINFPFSN